MSTETKELEYSVLDEKKNHLQEYADSLDDEQRKAYYAMRSARANETKKYKKEIQKACQALSNGMFRVGEDGVSMSGAEILAINCFERAKYSDKSLQTFIRLTGDYSDKVEEDNSNGYEKFIEDTKVVFK